MLVHHLGAARDTKPLHHQFVGLLQFRYQGLSRIGW